MATAAAFIYAPNRTPRNPATPSAREVHTPNYAMRRLAAAVGVACAIVMSLLLVDAVLASFESQPALAVDTTSAQESDREGTWRSPATACGRSLLGSGATSTMIATSMP